MNWALLLYASVVAVAKYLLPTESKPIGFVLVSALVLVAAIIFLVELHGAATEARDRIAALRRERGDLGIGDMQNRPADDHKFYLRLQIIIVAVGFALCGVIVWQLGGAAVSSREDS